LHGAMASYDAQAARLLGAIQEIGAAEPDCLDGIDLAHYDFHPENVLVAASGRICGVVDWDGASRSDGAFDLFTLRFVLARVAPGVCCAWAWSRVGCLATTHRRPPRPAGLGGAQESAAHRLVDPRTDRR